MLSIDIYQLKNVLKTLMIKFWYLFVRVCTYLTSKSYTKLKKK